MEKKVSSVCGVVAVFPHKKQSTNNCASKLVVVWPSVQQQAQ